MFGDDLLDQLRRNRRIALEERNTAFAQRQAAVDARAEAGRRRFDVAEKQVYDAAGDAIKRAEDDIAALDARIAEVKSEQDRAGRGNSLVTRVKSAAGDGTAAATVEAWAHRAAQAFARMGGAEGRAVVSGSIDVPNLVEPNVTSIPHPRRLIDLFTNRIPVDGNAFEFFQQTARTNAATTVADLATKPTSTLTVRAVQDRCRVIAHLSEPAPQRLLYDIPAFQQWLIAEMANGVLDGLEAQIISGSGSGENMKGLLATTGLTAVGYASDLQTTLRKAVTQLQILGETPTGWALNPADAEAFDLARWGTSGGWLSGGYQHDDRTGVSGSSDNVLGTVPRVISPTVPQGVAILGDWTKLRVYVRQEVGVMFDLSGDNFKANTFVARGEGRFGVGVLRPQSFAICDLTA